MFNYEFNSAFFTRKKDQCQNCVAYENAKNKEKKEIEKIYLEHQTEKRVVKRKNRAIKKMLMLICKVLSLLFWSTSCIITSTRRGIRFLLQIEIVDVQLYYVWSDEEETSICKLFHSAQRTRKKWTYEAASALLKYLEKRASACKAMEIVFYSELRWPRKKIIYFGYLLEQMCYRLKFFGFKESCMQKHLLNSIKIP